MADFYYYYSHGYGFWIFFYWNHKVKLTFFVCNFHDEKFLNLDTKKANYWKNIV